MSTLADLRKSATKIATFVDSTTPVGYFGAAYKDDLIGFATYLLRGTEGDDSAPIVGRIQNDIAYAGDQMLGGTYLGVHEYSENAFTAIINHTKWDEA